MVYSEKDIDFSLISPKEFENLCYEIVVSFGYHNVVWRQGGGDNGRDIEARLPFNTAFSQGIITKWFFECKHYINGVPAEDLNSKIAWADAENPDFLVIFTTSYITTSAKLWLEKIQPQKHYRIIIIEGEEIKTKLTGIQHLIPKYFSADKYIKLYEDIRRHRSLYRISPSSEVLYEIISNIPTDKFQLDDLAFLLSAYYYNVNNDERNDIFWDTYTDSFKRLPYPLFERLKQVSTQTDFSHFFNDYEVLDSCGFKDDADSEICTEKNFQKYILHLNFSNHEKWDGGTYILAILDQKEAFEIFSTKGEIHSYYHSTYDEAVLNSILSKFCGEEDIERIKDYANTLL